MKRRSSLCCLANPGRYDWGKHRPRNGCDWRPLECFCPSKRGSKVASDPFKRGAAAYLVAGLSAPARFRRLSKCF